MAPRQDTKRHNLALVSFPSPIFVGGVPSVFAKVSKDAARRGLARYSLLLHTSIWRGVSGMVGRCSNSRRNEGKLHSATLQKASSRSGSRSKLCDSLSGVKNVEQSFDGRESYGGSRVFQRRPNRTC